MSAAPSSAATAPPAQGASTSQLMPTPIQSAFSRITRVVLAAVLITAPVTVVTATPPAYADCGDPGQPPCNGPVPTVDQVIDILNVLFNPNIPAADKDNIVTPPFTPEEAATIDDHLNRMGTHGHLPTNWNITNIQSAPDNFAGVTIESNHCRPGPAVFVLQNGHWLMTHDTAWTALDNIWWNVTHHNPIGGGI